MTGPRADSPVTTEVNHLAHDGLLTVNSPASMWQASSVLAAPPLLGSVPAPVLQPAATCSLEPRPESVKLGRDLTRAALCQWGMAVLADMAELVVSELVTNALRHGVPSARRLVSDRPVRLKLLAQPPFMMCMVSDPGAEIPVLRESDPTQENGRGLRVVEACSVRWGWHLLDEGGKIVWALLR
jgi:anti-sigma regulatory factor (Ser/Thr protein kinase)